VSFLIFCVYVLVTASVAINSIVADSIERFVSRPTQSPTLSGTGNEYQPKMW